MSAAFPPSWYAASLPEPPALPSLQGQVQADVAVLGAGYTGLTAALELAPRNIRVNSVSPGPTETEIMKKALSETELDAVHNWLLERLPVRRIGKASDVGRMVVHLASDNASFITGSDFVLDGGMLLG